MKKWFVLVVLNGYFCSQRLHILRVTTKIGFHILVTGELGYIEYYIRIHIRRVCS